MNARRRLAILTLLPLALLCGACGSSFTPSASGSGDAQPLAAIYDFMVSVPGAIVAQLNGSGLTVDLELEIDPDGIDAGGFFEARITIIDVRFGGVTVPFTAESPLIATGRTTGVDFSVDSFGPIRLGTAQTGFTDVMLSLTGTLTPDGRRIEGIAIITSSGETGTFEAIKQRRYLVAGTDFGVTGTVSLVKVRYDTRFLVEDDLEAISGDPAATTSDGGVFIVNRFFFDNIQSLDPAGGFRTALQFSTGNGSNPHDALAVDPNRLYITRYEPPYNDVLIADRGTGQFLGFIDLTSLATNGDSTPRAESLFLADGLVLVGLQNIDGSFLEYGPGILAVVDPALDQVVSRITLVGRNPFGPPAVDPGTNRLYYAMAGIFEGALPRELSGGIEVVDPGTLTTLGLLVDDDDLGGNVSAVAVTRDANGARGFCVVTLPSAVNVVRAFDPDNGDIAPGEVHVSTAFIPNLVSDGDGYLVIAENDIGDPRLVVMEAATGRIVGTPRLSLPPFSIAVLTRDFIRD